MSSTPNAARRPIWLLTAIVVTTTFIHPLATMADPGGCAQARAVVIEIEQLYATGNPDHAQILARLKAMRDICPTLGELYKYSACSAAALGQTGEVNYFRTRASLASIKDLTCPGEVTSATQSPLSRTVNEKYALVVGIGSFQDPKIPRLRFAAKDARDLAALLTNPEYGRFDPRKVTLLTDSEATRERILIALQGLFDVVQEGDLVVLYISSHGSPHKSDSGLTGVGHIVTHDAALKSIFVNALSYEEFSHYFSLLKARRKVVFLDTCYSGEASKGSKALYIEAAGVSLSTAKLFLSGEGSYVITSSSASERSWESESLQNSYFTHFLIDALKRPGDPPTLGDVFTYLKRQVPEAVAREQDGAPQHPQIFPATGVRDLRLGVIPQSTLSNPSEKDVLPQ